MTYTPQELVQYVFENEMEADLFTAIMNSNEEYRVLPVTGKAEKTESGCQFVFDDIGLGLEPYIFSEAEMELLGEVVITEPENISACLILYNEVVQVIIDYCNGSNDEKRESMWSMIFADLFKQLDLNTRGKVKKFIERGLYNQLKYNELDKQKMKFTKLNK